MAASAWAKFLRLDQLGDGPEDLAGATIFSSFDLK